MVAILLLKTVDELVSVHDRHAFLLDEFLHLEDVVVFALAQLLKESLLLLGPVV